MVPDDGRLPGRASSAGSESPRGGMSRQEPGGTRQRRAGVARLCFLFLSCSQRAIAGAHPRAGHGECSLRPGSSWADAVEERAFLTGQDASPHAHRPPCPQRLFNTSLCCC